MLLPVRTGNLLESSAQTLVNTVNTVGVMGKGIALQFKQRFPEMYEDYVQRCKAGKVRLGHPYLFRGLMLPWVLNFPTKEHWRAVADLERIKEGLDLLVQNYRGWGITSIAVPPLGCGLGGLDWGVVGPTLGRYLGQLDIPVELYAPHGVPSGQLTIEFILSQSAPSADLASRAANKIPEGWLAVIAVLERITQERYHWPIGRVTLEKMSYFLTMSGVPTGLEFARASFGPHSAQYAGMRARLIQNGLLNESSLGRMLVQQPGETFRPELIDRDNMARWTVAIERVADLFTRIQTTQQAELAASAHFAANAIRTANGRRPSETEVFEYVRQWKSKRKPAPYPDVDIAEAVRNMAMLGWLDVTGSRDLPLAA